MKARLLVALVAGLMVAAADPAPDLGEVQLQEIPPGSRWVWVGPSGTPHLTEFGKDGTWRIYTRDGQEVLVSVAYTLMPTVSPPRIDTTVDGRGRQGIYRLDRNRLLICLGGARMRPVRFDDNPIAGYDLLVLQRLK